MVEADEGLDVVLKRLVPVVIKRRWWLIGPTLAVALAACLVALVIPNRYKSDATILVTQQKVPERYVTSNITADVREELLVMTDAILSRTQLLRIIDEFSLYPQSRRRLAPEELVKLMQKNITIEPTRKENESRDLNSFTISFTATDPRVAQNVTSKLTTLFIEENLKSREEQSTGTTNFLDDQLQAAAADLKRTESRVRDFKMQHLGQLPEQQPGNLAILSGLQSQLQNAVTSINRARQQQVYLESLLSQYQVMAVSSTPATTTAAPGPTDTIQAELTRLRNERVDLKARYTDSYPDVVKIDQQIKAAEAMLAAAKKSAPVVTATPKEANAADSNASTAQIKSQLEANRLEIQNGEAEQKRLETQIAEYQGRLDATPVREQQLAEVRRDYDQSRKNYEDLLSKKTQSQLATSLEERQQGAQFRIIDPPSLPMTPSGMTHVKISLGGLVAGLVIGIGLVFLMETLDHSLRDEEELRDKFAFPLLMGLPLMPSKLEEGQRKRLRNLEWVAGTVLSLLVCATEFYIYKRG